MTDNGPLRQRGRSRRVATIASVGLLLGVVLAIVLWLIRSSPQFTPRVPSPSEGASALSVLVTTKSGEPIDGARVRVERRLREHPETWGDAVEEATAADGFARFHGIPFGDIRATLISGGRMGIPVSYGSNRSIREIRSDAVRWMRSRSVELRLEVEIGGELILTSDQPEVHFERPTVSMKHKSIGGVWRPLPDQRRPEYLAAIPGARLQGGGRIRMAGLPPGAYLVQTQSHGRAPRAQEVTILAGKTTEARFDVGDALTELTIENTAGAGHRSLALNRWDDVRVQDILMGVVEDKRPLTTGGAQPGRYLVLDWRRQWGWTVDLKPGTRSVIVPPFEAPPDGPASVRVFVRHKGSIATPVLVALFRGTGRRIQAGEQFWFRDSASAGAVFDHLAVGDYRIAVFDGVEGHLYDSKVSPVTVDLSLGTTPSSIDIEL